MSDQEMTFDDAINALLDFAQQEEESLDKEGIDEGEANVMRVLLRGYRKALSDIKSIYAQTSADQL